MNGFFMFYKSHMRAIAIESLFKVFGLYTYQINASKLIFVFLGNYG